MRKIKLLEDQLAALNQEMAAKNITATFVLIGGFAGRYLLEDYRHTLDIDFLIKSISSNANAGELNSILEEFAMEEVTVVDVPPAEEFEANDVIEFSNLTVIIPTIEYFAITKIFSDRKKDEEDLIQEGILKACDPEKLSALIKDYRNYALNPDSLNSNYRSLKQVFEDYGIDV